MIAWSTWSVPARRSCGRARRGHELRQAAVAELSAPMRGIAGVAAGERDVVGLVRKGWDMIQSMRRADQAGSEATDATRTEHRSGAARNGGIAGQRLFRWAGMGSL
jgi:hypothetical protein